MTVDFTNRNKNSKKAASSYSDVNIDAGLRSYMLKVYKHMSVGVGITGVVAFIISQSASLMQMIYGTPLQWVVMLAPLAFIFFLGARMYKMSEAGAKACFYSFAAVMGLSISYIFLVYSNTSIARVFFITAATFSAMSLYGYTTKKDLTKLGAFLMMGLIGLIIAMIVNIFMQSTAMDFAISAIGVLIFVGLTAYDTQKIKDNYYKVGSNNVGKAAIIGALSLYLDFINLMLMLLRLFGERR